MCKDLEATVADWTDEGQVADYLRRLIRKEAYDRAGARLRHGARGLHALRPARARICHHYAAADGAGHRVRGRAAPHRDDRAAHAEIIAQEKGTRKTLCANIDLYTGFVYNMLGIPEELYTPLFATARMAGWAAHRFEELVSGRRIIRPAYKSIISHHGCYVPLDQRQARSARLPPEPIELPAQATSDADAVETSAPAPRKADKQGRAANAGKAQRRESAASATIRT